MTPFGGKFYDDQENLNISFNTILVKSKLKIKVFYITSNADITVPHSSKRHGSDRKKNNTQSIKAELHLSGLSLHVSNRLFLDAFLTKPPQGFCLPQVSLVRKDHLKVEHVSFYS